MRAGSSGRTATTTIAIDTTAITQRHGSANSFASETPSAPAAVSTAQPTRERLHATAGSPCTRLRTRRIGGRIMAAAGTTSAITPRNTQCQLSCSATTPASAGPTIDGMTQAAAKPANTRARSASG